MKNKSLKVIFDTNVWISFLIGKHLFKIKDLISDNRIIIITTEQLFEEIKSVTSRDKLKKYFPKESVDELIFFLESVSEKIEITQTSFVCRDPKDNFLLDLIDFSKADYIGNKIVLFKAFVFLSLNLYNPPLYKQGYRFCS